ncbi:unnamed protein product [Pseudo-nitzschia multistriata]|uniref:Uncharacterized protein n=1 Tax=Pseudo-nitzschia multistriata TaxID=183589 RepID=A0A448ZJJ9_9STRA|nr:unnamed protein product [Pseudo-nitzschia multistriata]
MDEEKGKREERRAFVDSSSESREMESLAPAVDEVGGDGQTSERSFGDDSNDDGDSVAEGTGFLEMMPMKGSSRQYLPVPSSTNASPSFSSDESGWSLFLHKTLLTDEGIAFRGFPLLESSGFSTKLLKFVCWTFLSICLVHLVVAQFFDDRDMFLRLSYVWKYEGDLIVRDCFVFFVVGRLWEKPGIDHLAWMGTALVANIYFESQNYIWFLQHSVTLFQMHCMWPWELWIFALALIVSAALLILLHALKAWNERILFVKLTEMGLCILFFIAPMITSNFFHMHHWYAGWLMGMHFNYDVWWSRLAMAWCWGMYVNGVAVYGRDPVMTCEYSYFLSLDNRCPYISCYLEGLADENNTEVVEMVPVDWRNCSATTGFIP